MGWFGQISSSVKLWSLRCLSRKAPLLPFSPSNPTPGRLPFSWWWVCVPFLFSADSQLIPIKESTNNQRISKESLGYDPFWDFFPNACERKPGRNTPSWFRLVTSFVTWEKSFSFSEPRMRHQSSCSPLLMAWLLMCLEKCQAQKRQEPVITACVFCCLETELSIVTAGCLQFTSCPFLYPNSRGSEHTTPLPIQRWWTLSLTGLNKFSPIRSCVKGKVRTLLSCPW